MKESKLYIAIGEYKKIQVLLLCSMLPLVATNFSYFLLTSFSEYDNRWFEVANRVEVNIVLPSGCLFAILICGFFYKKRI